MWFGVETSSVGHVPCKAVYHYSIYKTFLDSDLDIDTTNPIVLSLYVRETSRQSGGHNILQSYVDFVPMILAYSYRHLDMIRVLPTRL